MTVTDEMCIAAIDAMVPDRIQGFSYNISYVIRDVWKKPDEQVLWSEPKTEENEKKFHLQCAIERMRLGLEAALALTGGQK